MKQMLRDVEAYLHQFYHCRPYTELIKSNLYGFQFFGVQRRFYTLLVLSSIAKQVLATYINDLRLHFLGPTSRETWSWPHYKTLFLGWEANVYLNHLLGHRSPFRFYYFTCRPFLIFQFLILNLKHFRILEQSLLFF
jgi:hypothetical protein